MRAFILCVAILLISGNSIAETKYGSGADFKHVTAISEILSQPKKFVGKEITVSGKVVDVCKMKGCWMELAADTPDKILKIKVKDDVIIFPISSRGKMAAAKGVLKEINLTKKQTIAHLEHFAEEQGHKFDPSSVKGPSTIYQLQATGAVIK